MAEKLCAVKHTISGDPCQYAALPDDPDGLCKAHRTQCDVYGFRAWPAYVGYATHVKHVAGDDKDVPSVSKAAAIKYGLRKAAAKPMTALEEAKLHGATRKSTKKAKSKKMRALGVMAKDIAKAAAEIKQAVPLAEAPVVKAVEVVPVAE
ncbi:MAG: hypothetical protein ABSH52_15570 [Terriglobia bacterium]|jgi:hypothetical protein